MGLIVDTNIFINIENGRFEPTYFSKLTKYGQAYIAAITAAELLTGVQLASDINTHVKRAAFVENIITNIPILDFNLAVSRTYADLYAYFMKPRQKSGANVHDLQIAATAIAHDFAVLTINVKDFKKIPGLKIETVE